MILFFRFRTCLFLYIKKKLFLIEFLTVTTIVNELMNIYGFNQYDDERANEMIKSAARERINAVNQFTVDIFFFYGLNPSRLACKVDDMQRKWIFFKNSP